MNCPGCGGVIRDDEQTCDSPDCSSHDCRACDNRGWVPATWKKRDGGKFTIKEAETYNFLRKPCPECT